MLLRASWVIHPSAHYGCFPRTTSLSRPSWESSPDRRRIRWPCFVPFASGSFEGVLKGSRMVLSPPHRSSLGPALFRVSVFHFGKPWHPQKALFVDSNTFVQKLHVAFDILHLSVWCLGCCETLSLLLSLSFDLLFCTMSG